MQATVAYRAKPHSESVEEDSGLHDEPHLAPQPPPAVHALARSISGYSQDEFESSAAPGGGATYVDDFEVPEQPSSATSSMASAAAPAAGGILPLALSRGRVTDQDELLSDSTSSLSLAAAAGAALPDDAARAETRQLMKAFLTDVRARLRNDILLLDHRQQATLAAVKSELHAIDRKRARDELTVAGGARLLTNDVLPAGAVAGIVAGGVSARAAPLGASTSAEGRRALRSLAALADRRKQVLLRYKRDSAALLSEREAVREKYYSELLSFKRQLLRARRSDAGRAAPAAAEDEADGTGDSSLGDSSLSIDMHGLSSFGSARHITADIAAMPEQPLHPARLADAASSAVPSALALPSAADISRGITDALPAMMGAMVQAMAAAMATHASGAAGLVGPSHLVQQYLPQTASRSPSFGQREPAAPLVPVSLLSPVAVVAPLAPTASPALAVTATRDDSSNGGGAYDGESFDAGGSSLYSTQSSVSTAEAARRRRLALEGAVSTAVEEKPARELPGAAPSATLPSSHIGSSSGDGGSISEELPSYVGEGDGDASSTPVQTPQASAAPLDLAVAAVDSLRADDVIHRSPELPDSSFTPGDDSAVSDRHAAPLSPPAVPSTPEPTVREVAQPASASSEVYEADYSSDFSADKPAESVDAAALPHTEVPTAPLTASPAVVAPGVVAPSKAPISGATVVSDGSSFDGEIAESLDVDAELEAEENIIAAEAEYAAARTAAAANAEVAAQAVEAEYVATRAAAVGKAEAAAQAEVTVRAEAAAKAEAAARAEVAARSEAVATAEAVARAEATARVEAEAVATAEAAAKAKAAAKAETATQGGRRTLSPEIPPVESFSSAALPATHITVPSEILPSASLADSLIVCSSLEVRGALEDGSALFVADLRPAASMAPSARPLVLSAREFFGPLELVASDLVVDALGIPAAPDAALSPHEASLLSSPRPTFVDVGLTAQQPSSLFVGSAMHGGAFVEPFISVEYLPGLTTSSRDRTSSAQNEPATPHPTPASLADAITDALLVELAAEALRGAAALVPPMAMRVDAAGADIETDAVIRGLLMRVRAELTLPTPVVTAGASAAAMATVASGAVTVSPRGSSTSPSLGRRSPPTSLSPTLRGSTDEPFLPPASPVNGSAAFRARSPSGYSDSGSFEEDETDTRSAALALGVGVLHEATHPAAAAKGLTSAAAGVGDGDDDDDDLYNFGGTRAPLLAPLRRGAGPAAALPPVPRAGASRTPGPERQRSLPVPAPPTLVSQWETAARAYVARMLAAVPDDATLLGPALDPRCPLALQANLFSDIESQAAAPAAGVGASAVFRRLIFDLAGEALSEFVRKHRHACAHAGRQMSAHRDALGSVPLADVNELGSRARRYILDVVVARSRLSEPPGTAAAAEELVDRLVGADFRMWDAGDAAEAWRGSGTPDPDVDALRQELYDFAAARFVEELLVEAVAGTVSADGDAAISDITVRRPASGATAVVV